VNGVGDRSAKLSGAGESVRRGVDVKRRRGRVESGRAQLRADEAQIPTRQRPKKDIRLIGYDVAFRFAAVRGGNVKRARAEEKRTGGINVLFGVL
jgi:hypothetical protein